jgi:thiosulfate/3-mercaptopyruvate sulfurtransferase
MNRLMLIPLSMFWVTGAQIAYAASPVIADDGYVAEAIARNAIIWDVRPANAYAAGHIAGAVNIGDAPRVLRDDNTEDFIAIDRIEKILGAAGLDPKREIIVYGGRGSWMPYFGQYTIRYFGGDKVRVYHEGFEGWTAAGRAISREAPAAAPVALKLEIDPNVAATTKEVVARLNDPDVQIVDARTPQEFAGEDIRAIRGGHVPGAVNIPYEQNWVDPETPAKLSRKQVTSNACIRSSTPARKPSSTARAARGRRKPRVCCRSSASPRSRSTILLGSATAIRSMRLRRMSRSSM